MSFEGSPEFVDEALDFHLCGEAAKPITGVAACSTVR
jgi:hypothetical protein